ncbi:MAG: hypothetical protein HY723_01395 [Chloroflexi bacterium]|nr:hypothetical protein [Chloroflexota bacterium]
MWGKKDEEFSGGSDLGRLIEEIRAERERIRQNGHPANGNEAIPNEVSPLSGETPRRFASASRAIQGQALEQMRAALHQFQSSMTHPEPSGQRDEIDTDELMDLKRRLHQLCQRVEDVLNEIAGEVQRLTDEAARLAWREAVGRARREPASLAEYSQPSRAVPPPEPEFSAGAPLGIAFVAVPDFETLLDVQAALIELSAVARAVVIEFENEEALVEAALEAPATVRDIVDGLCQALGRQLLIEEADTEAHKLRLCFMEKEGRHFDDSILRPERWPKA